MRNVQMAHDQRPALPNELIEQAIQESSRYLVVGLVDNDPVAPVRWAAVYQAESARQAEDMAREEVHEEVVDGLHGHLLVAGVYQLDIDTTEVQIIRADKYARYADPDQD